MSRTSTVYALKFDMHTRQYVAYQHTRFHEDTCSGGWAMKPAICSHFCADFALVSLILALFCHIGQRNIGMTYLNTP